MSQVAQLKGVPLIRVRNQVSPSYSSTAFASLPFPSSRPGISIPIDHRSEGLLMAITRSQTLRKRTERSRRKYFISQHPAMTSD
jgi:hypothetical protein